jgi:hypothetical protein
MASTATTSGGWAASSPYIGANATTNANQAVVGSDGNVATTPATDVGAQLGQALSAYHTHQATATPAITAAATPLTTNSQGYGAAAANQNNLDLGAAIQASTPNTTPAPTSYAAPGQSKLGIAIQPTASMPSVAQTLQGALKGTQATAATSGAPTSSPASQSPYITYMGSNGQMNAARYDSTTGQYVDVDPNSINWGSTLTAVKTGVKDATGHDTYKMPTNITFADGTTAAYQDYSNQGKTFSLTNYNTQLSAAAAAQKAALDGLASGSNAARTSIQNTDTTAAPAGINNNQDFINQLSGQLQDINTSAGVQAADETSANTQSAINSQLSTSAYQSGDIGAAARYGAGSAVSAEGAGALSHEQAAANAYDATFAQIGQAASQQLTVADQETQAQASADVQSIADEVSSLQSQLGQLDATTANQVNQHLAQLQDQIAAYQNGVASYTGTAQASANDFKAILSAAAQVGTIIAAA